MSDNTVRITFRLKSDLVKPFNAAVETSFDDNQSALCNQAIQRELSETGYLCVDEGKELQSAAQELIEQLVSIHKGGALSKMREISEQIEKEAEAVA